MLTFEAPPMRRPRVETAPPQFSVDETVAIEFASSETSFPARVVGPCEGPLGPGWTFQIGRSRRFVYSCDMQRNGDSVIVTA